MMIPSDPAQLLFPALYLYALNGSFNTKHISLLNNRHVEISRQVDKIANRYNGFINANVLSKPHAELWEESGKIYIRDLKSTHGTFVNGESIGSEDSKLELKAHQVRNNDTIEFGRDILADNQKVIHRKVAARLICVVSKEDAVLAMQRDTAGLDELANTSMLGKRHSGDIEDQATAFKRARMWFTDQGYGSPEDSDDNITSHLREEATAGAPNEFQLLDDVSLESEGRSEDHEIRTAPLLTRGAYVAVGLDERLTQYGVLGRCLSIHSKAGRDIPDDSRLYVNTNAPFSAIICGLQGSGKSHTMSVLLENMFITNQAQIGSLEKALSGLVLHFGQGGPSSRPSEAAWVGVSQLQDIKPPPVRVYVSHSSLNTMKTVYAPLGDNVTIEPLFFNEAELDAESFLSMMAIGSTDSAPLYVQIILSILRDLGENFSLSAFQRILKQRKKSFNPSQLVGLDQRMSLLNAFMEGHDSTSRSTGSRFSAGQLTIIDLSDPFIDSGSACGIFEIIIRLFVRAEVETGKVLVVDEAHKYLSTSRGSSGLTKSLLTLTREQRHLAMRVLISTQEPTVVPPVLLDLCTVAILHRFSSPSWWDHLAQHVSADFSGEDAFDKVVKLQTGQAIVLAPSGFGVFKEHIINRAGDFAIKKSLNQFGRRYLLMKTRKRITSDGGASVLVLEP